MKHYDQASIVTNDDKAVQLVLFSASWSAPCRQQCEILDNFCRTHGNGLEITKIDIDRSPEFAMRWTIQSIPTTLLLSGNREISRFIGILSTSRLQTIVDSHVASTGYGSSNAVHTRR